MRKQIRTPSSSLVLLLALTTSSFGQVPPTGVIEPIPEEYSQEYLNFMRGDITAINPSSSLLNQFPLNPNQSPEALQAGPYVNLSSDERNITRFVSVEMQAIQGPNGESYRPPELRSGASNPGTKAIGFVSIVFRVSVAPFVVAFESQNSQAVTGVEYRDRDAKWVSAKIKLRPKGQDGSELKCEEEGDCSEYLQVLEILPNNSEAGTRERLVTQIASSVSEVFGLLEPFFPGTDFEARAAGGASGLGVIFRKLFPPKSVAYQYPYMASPTIFGWYFQQNKDNPESASLLGIHRGVVLLQINSAEVKEIEVKYQALSEWNNKANLFSKFDLTTEGSATIYVPQSREQSREVAVQELKNLTPYPMVISKENASDILQVSPEELDSLITENLVQQVGGKNVTKASLECFLGLIQKNNCPTIRNLESEK